MKNQSAEQFSKNLFFILRLCLILPILGLAVFYCKKTSALDNVDSTGDYYKDLLITEIMYNPAGNNSQSSQWVELYNAGDKDLFLFKETFSLNDDASLTLNKDGTAYLNCHKINENITIGAKKYILFTNNPTNFNEDHPLSDQTIAHKVSFTLSSKESSIRLSNDTCKHFFLEASYKNIWGGDDNGKTLEKNELDKNYDEKNWHESCADGGTPGKENSQKEDCKNEDNGNDSNDDTIEKISSYSGKIKINEIYSSPDTKAGEKEFIEIKNISNEIISLKNWIATDEKNKGKPIKNEPVLKPDEFYSFKGSFSLNQDKDTARIFDDSGNLVDSVSYINGKSRCYYALDGEAWRWTSQKTLGDNNKFDSEVSAKIKKDKNIYANAYANFSAKMNGAVKKFSWDFGDKHKSYIENTKHKYTKAKKYSASLTVSGICEQKIYDFTVSVKKYNAPKIRIVRISPNPKGNDTENEWIEIKNKSKKNVNLKDWSIATGWENFYNHPIREDFKIKAGKSKKLPREICAFTLANTKTKIELRDPSGKTVQSIEYDRGKNKMQEETLYTKENGKPWVWIEPPTDSKEKKSPAVGTDVGTDAPMALPSISAADLGKSSPVPSWENKIQNRNNLSNYGVSIKLASATNQEPHILGVSAEQKFSIPTEENFYSFTQNIPHKHWLEIFWEKINLKINLLFNLI